MKLITAISNDAKQSMNIVLDNGTTVAMTLEYIGSQKGWFASLVYGTIQTFNLRRVVTSPNMLRAMRSVIPFGLACVTTDGLEPIYIDDFSSGRASLYILNSTDVAYVEQTIIPGSHD